MFFQRRTESSIVPICDTGEPSICGWLDSNAEITLLRCAVAMQIEHVRRLVHFLERHIERNKTRAICNMNYQPSSVAKVALRQVGEVERLGQEDGHSLLGVSGRAEGAPFGTD
jgi:hypothetical protein